MRPQMGFRQCVVARHILLVLMLSVVVVVAYSDSPDQPAMEAILKNFTSKTPTGWKAGTGCCDRDSIGNWAWVGVSCDNGNRVTNIVIKELGLTGTLSPMVQNLTSLKSMQLMRNNLTGPFPSFRGLASLTQLLANENGFTSFPADGFFDGLSSLQEFFIGQNPFAAWEIPSSIKQASNLHKFLAGGANITGTIPDFFNPTFMTSLTDLDLGSNNLQGQLPMSLGESSIIQTLRLDNNKLSGSLDVLQNMTELNEVHLNMNKFTGPLPDLSKIKNLTYFYVRDNQLTGIIPSSLVNQPSLQNVTLGNNLFQGPKPQFKNGVGVDMVGKNQFCNDTVGQDCDPRVNILLSIAKDMNYPTYFAENWAGNDPCSWPGMTCSGGNITKIYYPNKSLAGTISANFSLLTWLTDLRLNNNFLTGTIPVELTKLPNLKNVDLSNNELYGTIPKFGDGVVVKLDGNPDIGKDKPSSTPSGTDDGGDKKSKTGLIIGVVVACVTGLVLVGVLLFCMLKRKQQRPGKVQSPNTLVIHPSHSGDQNAVKISVANRLNGNGNESYSSPQNNGPNEINVEAGNMIISIQVLRSVTNNFSENKILGKGGFGTVYEGELHDGTKMAVKRMESGVVAEKGLHEFKSEIAVLTKVRHRHLVGLLGYCLDGNERLLVYEHMPQGPLSRHLFNWKEEGLQPLEWTRRLTIALDVARGVEYLHGLANEIFIHRDLKPSNILLGDDMRAKVADFGLVRLATPAGKASIATRLAGTFGYLAPEYAATGRMTVKVDVYSFGVILMELITGRKAIDESQPEESCHLVTWFRRKLIKTDALPDIVDPTIDVNVETLSSISMVAELAGHCCAREPYQRPDMSHAVNILSSLVEQWKPSKPDYDEIDCINFDVPLNEAVKMWQAAEGKSNITESSSSSAVFPSGDTTHTSIPSRPSGFADSFTSSDGR